MPDLLPILSQFIEERDADVFLYSGEITSESASEFIDRVHAQRDISSRRNFCLFLCTGGGDPDAGYKIAKYIANNYEALTLYICGPCKSTGTLIALSANEIVMSSQGELGPLDTQTSKRDEIFFQSSSLDLLTAFEYLAEQSQELFDKAFIRLQYRSNGAITAKTAADIAGKLTNGLLDPILGQIEPLRLGEIQRELKIASDYGVRLCGNQEVVDTLIYNYPSHSFVIDLEEAKIVFESVKLVRVLTDLETELKILVTGLLKSRFGANYLRVPNSDGVLSLNLSQLMSVAAPNINARGDRNEQENESNNGTVPSIESENNTAAREASASGSFDQ